jgi:hypothetical protein
MAVVACPDAEQLLLTQYLPQIKLLLQLQQMEAPVGAYLEQLLQQTPSSSGNDGGSSSSTVPPSWLLPARESVPTAAQQQPMPQNPAEWARQINLNNHQEEQVRRQQQLVPAGSYNWLLSVADLRAACQKASSSGESVALASPGTTPPVLGLVWSLKLDCVPVDPTVVGSGSTVAPGTVSFGGTISAAAAAAGPSSSSNCSSSVAFEKSPQASSTVFGNSSSSSNVTGVQQGSGSSKEPASNTTNTNSSSSGSGGGSNDAEVDHYLPVGLRLTAVAENAPPGMLMHLRLQYSYGLHGGKGGFLGLCRDGWTVSDPLGLGPMGAGWDAEKWVSRGLPASGVCELTITVNPAAGKPNPLLSSIERW